MSELSFVALTPTSFLARSALVHGDRIGVIDGARPQRPDLLLCDLDLEPFARDALSCAGEIGTRLVTAHEYEQMLADAPEAWHEVDDERGLLSINYASGTTGRPKGVMYHHRGAYLQSLAMAFHASLRIATGGAPPSPALLERSDELGIEITHQYGLTETFGPVVICDWRGSWDDLPAGDGETLGEIALLRDRLKDVIVSGGENIASVEVEQAIQRRGVRGRPAQDGHREGAEVPAARAIPERPDGAGRPREVNGWITKR